MKVMVTGGAGFIGSHVVDAFLERGDEVVVVDDLSSGSRDNVPDGVELVELDVADGAGVRAAMARLSPDFVPHLAAQSSVTVSVSDPDRDFASNVLGTFNVVRAASELGARTAFASTGGALYGEDAPMPTPETHVPRPLSPYGAGKQAGEAFVSTLQRFLGVAHVVLRLGNVYGPRQNPHGEAGVVAIFSERLLEDRPLAVYGHGTPTRDYVHVRDITRAFTTVADTEVAGTFNLGWGREVSVLEVLDGIQRAAGTAVEPRLEPLRPGELRRSAIDSSAAAAAFGWRPEIELDEGLAETFRWYAETRGELTGPDATL
ncbi:MAG TPA: NAD-dependent epimerase/dehydratase family protein [Gaiellaceae bacterium]|nr:NAD-dependent epimerase/dehydratase family protein [Gaiellaceae bacterium]